MTLRTCGLVLFLACGASTALAEGNETKPAAAACVRVATEARYRNYGYDHIVTLRNDCQKAATCSVKTDVNPSVTSVELAVKEEKSVITFTGSPSRVFSPDVSCKEHD